MMLYLLVHSGRHAGLAEAESRILCGARRQDAIGGHPVVTLRNQQYHRLAYTKQVHEVLFRTQNKDHISRYPWEQLYSDSFSVRAHGGLRQRRLADRVYDRLKTAVEPRVRLEEPQLAIHFFREGDEIVATRLLWQRREDFEARKPHRRPAATPISLQPQLARAMVNLTGIRRGVAVDPCCGTGGYLLEAALMGLSVRGYDIRGDMVRRTEQVLSHFGCNDYVLAARDCLQLRRQFAHIVTDLPYGRNTSGRDLDRFYEGFFAWLGRVLRRRAAVSFARQADVEPLLPRRLAITESYDYYIHRSLTKRIAIIQPAR